MKVNDETLARLRDAGLPGLEAHQHLLSDVGIKNQIAALKSRYQAQISDEKALDFLLWSVGKKR